MIKHTDMGRNQISLLLYLETCLVDDYGRLKAVKMNEVDFSNLKQWRQMGFIDFGRLPGREVFVLDDPAPKISMRDTHWVRFTDDAWELAHQLRRERAEKYSLTIQAE